MQSVRRAVDRITGILNHVHPREETDCLISATLLGLGVIAFWILSA